MRSRVQISQAPRIEVAGSTPARLRPVAQRTERGHARGRRFNSCLAAVSSSADRALAWGRSSAWESTSLAPKVSRVQITSSPQREAAGSSPVRSAHGPVAQLDRAPHLSRKPRRVPGAGSPNPGKEGRITRVTYGIRGSGERQVRPAVPGCPGAGGYPAHSHRVVAQLGSAPRSGRGGPQFKSGQPDQHVRYTALGRRQDGSAAPERGRLPFDTRIARDAVAAFP